VLYEPVNVTVPWHWLFGRYALRGLPE